MRRGGEGRGLEVTGLEVHEETEVHEELLKVSGCPVSMLRYPFRADSDQSPSLAAVAAVAASHVGAVRLIVGAAASFGRNFLARASLLACSAPDRKYAPGAANPSDPLELDARDLACRGNGPFAVQAASLRLGGVFRAHCAHRLPVRRAGGAGRDAEETVDRR